MSRFTLFLLFSILAGAEISQARFIAQRMIGGNNTTINAYPSFALVTFNKKPACGGALVKQTTVVTSASCIYRFYPKMIQVQLGSATAGDGDIFNVTRFIIHPQFTSTGPSSDYNVALLILNRYVSTSALIRMVTLQTLNLDIPTGKLGTVVGFGTTSWEGPRDATLQAVDLPRVRDIACQGAYPDEQINDTMICFGDANGRRDSCGASGSPLYYGDRLAGIDSWSYGCGLPNTPRIFTKISNEDIQNFILKN